MKTIRSDDREIEVLTRNGVAIVIDDDFIVVNGNLIPIKSLLPDEEDS